MGSPSDVSRTVVARYKGWQGVWKTSEGNTFNIMQKGKSISAQQQDGPATLMGPLEYDAKDTLEHWRAIWNDGNVVYYDIYVTLSGDCLSFSGKKTRRPSATGQDFSADLVARAVSPR